MLANPSQTPTTQIAQELELTALSGPSSSTFTTSPEASELHTLCSTAISALPNEVAALRKGNKNVLNKIVGRVMKDSRGRADAKAVRNLVEKLITDEKQSPGASIIIEV